MLTLIPPTATIVLSECLHRIGTKYFQFIFSTRREAATTETTNVHIRG